MFKLKRDLTEADDITIDKEEQTKYLSSLV